MENGKSSIVNNQSSIIIIYLPQYLQYLGFILTFGTFVVVILKLIKNKKGNLTENEVSDKLPTI